MNSGFQSATVSIRTADLDSFGLLKPLAYVGNNGNVYVCPAMADNVGESDGVSRPTAIASVVDRGGLPFLPSIVHDAAYRGTLQRLDGSLWMLTKEECDSLFLEAMLSVGVNEIKAAILYNAVLDFGQSAFNQDRDIK